MKRSKPSQNTKICAMILLRMAKIYSKNLTNAAGRKTALPYDTTNA
ncbi:hypothetical protein HMPREF0299_5473 [Corynebacterium matruchotii ATCC 14266]|uniref:Uncharacterized protein n=1 Tax=Corynebacterium matruchotii ATCC 14266 TaxID=553207 RepID=E0DIG2_9CORY|nr:hypothetical protein HMPREF0299_5473 [Corynebacterium matruchotii ATCC 14266]